MTRDRSSDPADARFARLLPGGRALGAARRARSRAFRSTSAVPRD